MSATGSRAADQRPGRRDRRGVPGRVKRGLLAESARVEAFSDGVLAIVITLLVLDLHAPSERGHILSGLLHQWPVYVAYLASFAYVGVIWVNHHALFTRIRRVDTNLLWCNLALLLTTSVLPFPTAVLGDAFQDGTTGDQAAATVLYMVVSAAMAATWLLLFHHLSRHPQLLENNVGPQFFAKERRRALLGVVSYGVAGLVGAWLPQVALVFAVLLPVFYAFSSEGLEGEVEEIVE